MAACVLIMAGGTGGHVFPALAVADELRSKGLRVVWLGTRAGLEAEIVPKAGIAMEWVKVSGLRGKGWLSWAAAPARLMIAVGQALVVLRRVRPQAVLGMGGFVTGPGGVASWLLGAPLLIHEQNAIAGMTNRWLAPLAKVVMEAFPGTFEGRVNAVTTGNPVRGEIAAVAEPEVRFAERSGAIRLLVLGGSLGAAALNDVVPEALAALPLEKRPEVWHQAGRRNFEQAKARYGQHGVDGRVEPFIDDMAQAYAWADLVLCRAGALTVSELAAAGVGAILVPYPYAVDDHQSANAQFLVETGAAVMVRQEALSAQRLRGLFEELGMLAAGGVGRDRLAAMARAARALARPAAAAEVAHRCMEAACV